MFEKEPHWGLACGDTSPGQGDPTDPANPGGLPARTHLLYPLSSAEISFALP